MSVLRHALDTTHQGFPVVRLTEGVGEVLVGLVSRAHLKVLLLSAERGRHQGGGGGGGGGGGDGGGGGFNPRRDAAAADAAAAAAAEHDHGFRRGSPAGGESVLGRSFSDSDATVGYEVRRCSLNR